jgi:uncharacterized lipoprotein YddW (UPF0748 family)
MKKFGLLLIVVVLAFIYIDHVQAGDVILNQATTELTITDPNPITNPEGAFFQGFRAGNQLIRYTPAFGKSTDTNEYGTEVTIVGQRVVQKTGSNSLIPPDGFVLSGHGRAKAWLNENTIIGTKIIIENETNTITAITTPESHMFAAELLIDEVEKKLKTNTSKNRLAPSQKLLKEARSQLELSRKYLKQDEVEKAVMEAKKSYNQAEKAYFASIIGLGDKPKGIWLRPAETNEAEIINKINRIAEAGFNTIYLETFFHGYTIYPSNVAKGYGIENQNPKFKAADVLQLWVQNASKKNLKVVPWIETFYVGTGSTNPILSVKPAWANVQMTAINSTKPEPSTLEPGAYFLDPANPEARQYVVDIIKEIVTNYDVAGINLDYIRYPNSLPKHFPDYFESTWGYSDYARREFNKCHKIDPANLCKCDNKWYDWVQYRQSKVNIMVKDVYSTIKAVDKEVKLSAVVFPDHSQAKIQKLQSWKVWVKNGYIDALTPIILGSSPELVESYTRKMQEYSEPIVDVYTGVFGPFNNDLPVIFVKQIQAARNGGADGINVFDFAHLKNEYVNALIQGPFKKAEN